MLSQVSGFPRTHFDDRLGTDDASSSGGDAKRSGCGYISLLRETFAAEDRATLGGAKGDGSLLATLRAGGSSFDTGVMAPAADRLRQSKNGDAFGFANLTALRFVLELFVVKKQLFPGGEASATRGESGGHSKHRLCTYPLKLPLDSARHAPGTGRGYRFSYLNAE